MENLPYPLFAVDNDLSSVNKFDAANITAYWLCREGKNLTNILNIEPSSKVRLVNKLQQIPIGD